jgi:hypothetical protein
LSNYGTVTGDPQFVATWNRVVSEMEAAKQAWIADLRERGIKAAHPDDGWVDRNENSILFCYPQFNDGVDVGDFVALGHPDKYRIVQITDFRDLMFGDRRWLFVE